MLPRNVPAPSISAFFLAFFFCTGWYYTHSTPSASSLLREQIRADLIEVRHFIDTAINFANHSSTTTALTSAASENQTLSFIEKLSANNIDGVLVIEVTFQKNDKNPKISPLLAGKTIQFIGLNEHAQIAYPPTAPKVSRTTHQHAPTPTTKKKSSFVQTMQNFKKKLKKTHNEKALQLLLQKTQEKLDKAPENGSRDKIKSHTDKEENVSALACTRFADQHGQFFAEESTQIGTIDLFAQLPSPYNACRKKKA